MKTDEELRERIDGAEAYRPHTDGRADVTGPWTKPGRSLQPPTSESLSQHETAELAVEGELGAETVDEASRSAKSVESTTHDNTASSYTTNPGGIWWKKPGADGTVTVRLTNFTATIKREIEIDDGVERKLAFEMKTQIKGRRQTFPVQASEFAALAWVPREIGGQAIVFPGQTIRDHARAAIQILSGDIPRETVFTHTGWRSIGGVMVYLHAGGAIGPNGPVPGVRTELYGNLGLTLLPEPVDPIAAVTASLRLLDLGPSKVMYPLYATIWRATLGFSRHTLWLAGLTGAFKSQTAALAQQHWGAGFDDEHVPAKWSSTENSIEAVAFIAKDMLAVVDDYAPSNLSMHDAQGLQRKADRVLRAQGNGSGRQRCAPDGSLRPEKPPRGALLSTGEDLPRGHSIRARCSIVEVEKGTIPSDRLTACQRDAAAGLYAQAMATWLQWVAERFEARVAEFHQIREALQAEQIDGAHARTVYATADLRAAFRLFMRFAVAVEALSGMAAARHVEACDQALQAVALDQIEQQLAENPTRRFLALIGAAIASKQAHLIAADRPDEMPPDPGALGWQAEPRTLMGETVSTFSPSGPLVGYVRGEVIYLEPDAAYATAQRLASAQGGAIAMSEKTLWKRLGQDGLLAKADAGKNTTKIAVGSRRPRTVAIPAAHILSAEWGQRGHWGQGGAKPIETHNSSADFVPPKSKSAEKWGHGMGAGMHGEAGAEGGVPAAPPLPLLCEDAKATDDSDAAAYEIDL